MATVTELVEVSNSERAQIRGMIPIIGEVSPSLQPRCVFRYPLCGMLRPATPSNVPLIGKTRLPNFFLNTGHGTLGWTHSCGSGKSIARIVSGLAPEVDFAFTGA